MAPLNQPYDQFILFGDSLTQMSSNQDDGFGYHPALQEAYSRRLDVINRGFSGYTSAMALKVLPKFFPRPETATVRFLAICLGCNDAVMAGMYQHVPLETYKSNLRQIVQHPMVKIQNPRIFLLTPPPVNQYQLEVFDASEGVPHPSRTAAQTRKYADAVIELGKDLDVPVVDLWSAFMRYVGWKEGDVLVGSREAPNNEDFEALFTDGLHLTGKAYKIEFDAVMEVIERNWPDQIPEKLEMVVEDWREAPM
ncbi:GDSL Lipase/Acylhydrolase family protein [Aspergillus tamarii]|uniref:GDSL Lipase/Acylhydrolase family protein n=1 Tax=Aspergillus tamarii TaxID=41984 RepID=A0A5N6UXG0_ASPTM|nr:GDSL Lipase/Acylhydrolase family protein [Aspergillus tamarii]